MIKIYPNRLAVRIFVRNFAADSLSWVGHEPACKHIYFFLMVMTGQTNRTSTTTTPFEVVLAYLHSINLTTETKRDLGYKLMDEAQREDASIRMREQFRIQKDLELFFFFFENWDGENGLPVNTKALRNMESILPFLSSRCLMQIDIFPENNGSLLIMWRDKEAGINIGSDTYTYYSVSGKEVSGESHLPFNVDDVLEKAEKLAA